VVRPLEIVERDDPEGAVALHGDGVPSQPFPLVVFLFQPWCDYPAARKLPCSL
jgi:hypothetical protein